MRQGQLAGEPCCPVCHKLMDGFTDPTGRKVPEDGDASLCVYCLSLNIFTINSLGLLVFRRPTPAELRQLMSQADVRKMLDALARVKGRRAGHDRKVGTRGSR